MRDYRSDLSKRLTPYVGGEQPKDKNLIKLNTNENPYPPSPRVHAAVSAQIDLLHLYPEISSEGLQRTIAAQCGLSPAQVHVGNGSDEILAFCFAAFFAGKPLYAPDITYSFYPTYAQLFGVDYHTLPLREDFTLDVDALCNAPGGIILANPNAPTSLALPLDALTRLCTAAHARGCVIVIDEAYAAFAAEDALPLLVRFNNLVITRTLSKAHSLAGLRVGYALGQTPLIQALADVKDSFNTYPVDRLASAAAIAALEDTAYFATCTARICQTRDACIEALTQMGMHVLPSQTNFLFVRHPKHDGKAMASLLRAQGILVRHLSHPRLTDYVRISIGTPAQMDAVLSVYRASC